MTSNDLVMVMPAIGGALMVTNHGNFASFKDYGTSDITPSTIEIDHTVLKL